MSDTQGEQSPHSPQHGPLNLARSATTLTFDFGTTSLKTAVVRDGGILAEDNRSYVIDQPQTGWAEQAPEDLWAAAVEGTTKVLHQLRHRTEPIDAVIFVAPWKAAIPVSEAGDVLNPAIIWLDGRAEAEAQQLNTSLGEFVGTGQEYWPRLMWMKKHRTEVWNQARWIMGLVTFLKWKATGRVATEPSDDFIRSHDPADRERLTRIIDKAGLSEDLEKFAPAGRSTDCVGGLTVSAAVELGLPPATPVFGGFGDLPAITAGSGPVRKGANHIYFGTSSWFVAVEDYQHKTPSPLEFRIDNDFRAALYPQQTGCLAYDWIVHELYGHEKAHLDDAFQDHVNAEVDQVAPGSEGLVATHWLHGELPPLSKKAKGLFLNLTTGHDRRHLVRAMMESLCYGHRDSIERHLLSGGMVDEEIVVVGGGASSTVWMQMLADVLKRTVRVPTNPRYTGVLGAHYCGLIGLGERADWTEVRGGDSGEQVFVPNPAHADVYDRGFRVYQKLFPNLIEVFEELNGPAHGL